MPMGLVRKAFPNPIKAFFATPKAELSHFITLPVLVTVPVKASSSFAALIALNNLNGIAAAENTEAKPLNANFVVKATVLNPAKPPATATPHLMRVLCSFINGVSVFSIKPCRPKAPTAFSQTPTKLSKAELSVAVLSLIRSCRLACSRILAIISSKPFAPFWAKISARRPPSIPNNSSATKPTPSSPYFWRIFCTPLNEPFLSQKLNSTPTDSIISRASAFIPFLASRIIFGPLFIRDSIIFNPVPKVEPSKPCCPAIASIARIFSVFSAPVSFIELSLGA